MFNGDKNISALYPYHDVEVVARKQRRMLWIGTAGLLVGYMVCAGVAYKSVKNTKTSYNKAILGADNLLDNAQRAICTNDGVDEYFTDCDDGSVGDFLSVIKLSIGEIMDSGLNLAESLGTTVTMVGNFGAHLSSINNSLISMEQGMNDINTNLTAAQAAVDALPDDTEINMPTIAIPSDIIGQLQTAQAVIDTVIIELNETETDLQETLVDDESQVGRFRLMTDDIPGNEADGDADVRGEVMDVLRKSHKELVDITEMVSEFRTEQLNELKGTYDSQFNHASFLVFALLALPCALLLLLSLCAMTIRSPKPLYCSMVFGFFALGIYCLISGLCLALVKITTDTCNNLDTMLVTNLPDSYEFTAPNGKPIQTPPLGEVAIALSQCQGFLGDEPDTANNFISILQLGELLDISDMLGPANTALNSVIENIEGQDITDQLNKPIDSIPDDFNFDADDLLVVCSESIQESSSLLSQVPPATFDRDDPHQVELFENFYMTELPFVWNEGATRRQLRRHIFHPERHLSAPGTVYSLNVKQLSVILRAMQENNDFIGCGGSFFNEFNNRIDSGDPPLSYNFVKTLDYDKHCASGSGAFLSTNNAEGDFSPYCTLYTSSGYTATDVCPSPTGFLNSVNTQTLVINALDEKNTQLVDATTEFNEAIINVRNGIVVEKSGIDNIAKEKQSMYSLVEDFSDFFTNIVDVSIPRLLDQINNMDDLVSSADQYVMCGFLGDAYDTIVEEALCNDLVKDIKTLAGCVLAVALLMFVGFCFHGIYAISLRKRIIPGGTKSKGDFDNGILIPSRTPPVSPTELASVGKTYFEQPTLISRDGCEFTKPPPYSPAASINSYETEPTSPQPLI